MDLVAILRLSTEAWKVIRLEPRPLSPVLSELFPPLSEGGVVQAVYGTSIMISSVHPADKVIMAAMTAIIWVIDLFFMMENFNKISKDNKIFQGTMI